MLANNLANLLDRLNISKKARYNLLISEDEDHSGDFLIIINILLLRKLRLAQIPHF